MNVVYQEGCLGFLKDPEELLWYTFKEQREVGRGQSRCGYGALHILILGGVNKCYKVF